MCKGLKEQVVRCLFGTLIQLFISIHRPHNYNYYICNYCKLFWINSFQLDGITFILSPVAPFMRLDGTVYVVPSVGPDGFFAPLWWMSLPHLSIGTMQGLV